eukprot:m.58183 g.58183  ORF g.58183 m.58183 type:complete len:954 (+) comp15881_c0_seq2:125-2986(+)
MVPLLSALVLALTVAQGAAAPVSAEEGNLGARYAWVPGVTRLFNPLNPNGEVYTYQGTTISNRIQLSRTSSTNGLVYHQCGASMMRVYASDYTAREWSSVLGTLDTYLVNFFNTYCPASQPACVAVSFDVEPDVVADTASIGLTLTNVVINIVQDIPLNSFIVSATTGAVRAGLLHGPPVTIGPAAAPYLFILQDDFVCSPALSRTVAFPATRGNFDTLLLNVDRNTVVENGDPVNLAPNSTMFHKVYCSPPSQCVINSADSRFQAVKPLLDHLLAYINKQTVYGVPLSDVLKALITPPNAPPGIQVPLALVGGSVIQTLQNNTAGIHDLDFTSGLTYEDIQRALNTVFAEHGVNINNQQMLGAEGKRKQFGMLKLFVENAGPRYESLDPLDIAPFKVIPQLAKYIEQNLAADKQTVEERENYYWYGMSYSEDAKTRDFTANAVYLELMVDPNSGSLGFRRIVDPVGGLADLSKNLTVAANPAVLESLPGCHDTAVTKKVTGDRGGRFRLWKMLGKGWTAAAGLVDSVCRTTQEDLRRILLFSSDQPGSVKRGILNLDQFFFKLARKLYPGFTSADVAVSTTNDLLKLIFSAAQAYSAPSCNDMAVLLLAAANQASPLLGMLDGTQEAVTVGNVISALQQAVYPPPSLVNQTFPPVRQTPGGLAHPTAQFSLVQRHSSRLGRGRPLNRPSLQASSVTADVTSFLSSFLASTQLMSNYYTWNPYSAALDFDNQDEGNTGDLSLSSGGTTWMPGAADLTINHGNGTYIGEVHKTLLAFLNSTALTLSSPTLHAFVTKLQAGDIPSFMQTSLEIDDSTPDLLRKDLAQFYGAGDVTEVVQQILRCKPTVHSLAPLCNLTKDAVVLAGDGTSIPVHSFLVAARIPMRNHMDIGINSMGSTSVASLRTLTFSLDGMVLPDFEDMESFVEVIYGDGIPVPGDPTRNDVLALMAKYSLLA